MAAIAPAAGGAMAVPMAPAIAAPTESPELLALGAELEAKLVAYRAAAARLAEARATAASLWPEAPAGIVVNGSMRRGRYPDCYEEEIDFEGARWPNIAAGFGRGATLPRFIAVSGALMALLDEVRADPESWEDGFEQELVERIGEADRYEDACFAAIEGSDIETRKNEAEACADALFDLAHRLRKHPPRTQAGILIHAHALAGYANVQKDGFLKAPAQASAILGRGLADAVLRVAGASA
jgi:hypothetical protein